ncbi:uncharacterized protein BJ212DRAFT_1480047 [Suillus subaureus]|uniref:Uncharacterized protein n=1 Tax=Suillus subaureus TaxID=48587 RepID=A0A9P7JEB7_9AGAM|nr:uncharacterized protein BJ212DRAFT_1480047 [Suillus subaureus]KAG1817477.1 hypothetical protein BJ212DRAFT_1480047 [Suillus subaureus]
MALAASSGGTHQVTIHVALHHLKPEGKSGTVLVGNIERDMHIGLNVTLTELRSIACNQLNLLWAEWSHNHLLSLYSLEMHKSPKMLLYDPQQPSLNADEPVLQDVKNHVAQRRERLTQRGLASAHTLCPLPEYVPFISYEVQ